jgi:hypothetical protein
MTGDSLQLRVVTSNGKCPEIFQDGKPSLMELRAAADSHFPAVCQSKVVAEKTLTLSGHSLPIHPKTINRIVIFGDTGCRIKKDEKTSEITIQACNDPAQWPFQQLAELAADNHHPDLVLHVGDYYYRESKCPEDEPGCKDSPWGDRWESWNKDFFEPARKLLQAAPWVFVRGNHEDCKRGGKGWARFFDPKTPVPRCPFFSKPNIVHLSGLNLYALDSSEAEDDKSPEEQVAAMYYQLEQIKRELQANPGWILIHNPFWGIRPRDSAVINRTEQEALHQISGTDPLPGLELVLSGHIHEFSSLSFALTKDPSKQRSPQWIIGSGGDKLEIDPPYDPKHFSKVVDGVEASVFMMEGFGFVVLDRDGESKWTGKLLDDSDHELAKCSLERRTLSCGPPGGAPSR